MQFLWGMLFGLFVAVLGLWGLAYWLGGDDRKEPD